MIRKHILVFYPHNFYEMSSGTHRRIYDLLCYFKDRGFLMDLLSINGFSNRWNDEDLERKDFFDSIRVCEWKPSFIEKWCNFRRIKTGRLPNRAIQSLCLEFSKMTANRHYDFILINYVFWASLADNVSGDVKKVIELHDFITLNLYLKNKQEKFRFGPMFEEEIHLISKFHYALSISEEMLFLSPFCPKTKFVNAPISFQQKDSTNNKYDYDLLFVGSDNPFNREGIAWFVEKVYPLLPSNLSIAVVGKICNFLKENNDIVRIPYISDLDEIYHKTKLSFCPLKGGTGLKVKVIEALSYGKPVVTTSWGLSGVVHKNNNGCIIADHEEDFAEAILLLLRDNDQYQRIKRQGEKFFSSHYTPEICYGILDSVFLNNPHKKRYSDV